MGWYDFSWLSSSRNDVDFNNFNDAQTYFLDRIKVK
jgi:hypothetical protein